MSVAKGKKRAKNGVDLDRKQCTKSFVTSQNIFLREKKKQDGMRDDTETETETDSEEKRKKKKKKEKTCPKKKVYKRVFLVERTF